MPDDAAEGAVLGWVGGAPVPSQELGPHLEELATSPVGLRLGLGASADETVSGTGTQRATAVRSWGTRALLLDRLVALEAARLGVAQPGFPDDWVDCLQAAGEVCLGPPSEQEALRCYRANHYRYRVAEGRRVRHVLLSDRPNAERVYREVAGGRELADLALQSLDAGTRARGGDLGWVERGQLAGALEELIFAAEPGRAYGPVESHFGWHVLVVDAIRHGRVRPFSECKGEILSELAIDRRQAAWREWWQRRVAENITVPDGSQDLLAPGLPGTSHRH
ncbi:MAG TPA: peptidylprolyl isomerase [Acidimicrobiales bacterium]|nr:peptidylprolyl isomerase [Acidimicrobiales bacterium]